MFIILDVETTDREPEKAHVVEWALVAFDVDDGIIETHTAFVRPPIDIPPHSSAIHHIIDTDVSRAPSWEKESEFIGSLIKDFGAGGRIEALVAHNIKTERHFIDPIVEGSHLPWLCTYKTSLRLWPDLESHSNEGLRYALKLPRRGRRYYQAQHSALHDANVTAGILPFVLDGAADLETLIKWSSEPAALPRCPIGKFRNVRWPEVDTDYLEWILYKTTDMREDVLHSARLELERRAEAERVANSVDDDVPF